MGRKCCFAGHRKIYDEFEDKLKDEIEKLIVNEGVDEFWVGNYGVFDITVAKVVRELKDIYNIKLVLVLPYITDYINSHSKKLHKEFDELIIADMPERTPLKYRIIKCNEYMVKNSDYLICYVRYSWGGASKTMEYAQKKKSVKIINLGK